MLLELKDARQLTRLARQVTTYADLVDAHADRFASLFGALLGEEVTFDAPTEKWIVWPLEGVDRHPRAGTLAGSAIGWAGAAFGHESLVAYGVAIFLGVIVCEGLRLERSGGICAVTTSVIMLIPRPLPAHVVALHRFLEVCCGLLGALVISAVVDRLARVRASRSRL